MSEQAKQGRDVSGERQNAKRRFRYWNTPGDQGLTRRQRKWARENGVPADLVSIATAPCLGGGASYDGPACRNGSCVTCEARRRMADRLEQLEARPDRDALVDRVEYELNTQDDLNDRALAELIVDYIFGEAG